MSIVRFVKNANSSCVLSANITYESSTRFIKDKNLWGFLIVHAHAKHDFRSAFIATEPWTVARFYEEIARIIPLFWKLKKFLSFVASVFFVVKPYFICSFLVKISHFNCDSELVIDLQFSDELLDCSIYSVARFHL